MRTVTTKVSVGCTGCGKNIPRGTKALITSKGERYCTQNCADASFVRLNNRSYSHYVGNQGNKK